mmetsp:Transcript_19968/g.20014  ORF Transcript_19968/g.20014 Transcript_19968/m.20014 type:complete len:301 (+) Transcript_19968:15-917(+)
MDFWIILLLFALPVLLFKLYKKTRPISFVGKTVWITGASSGIGEFLAYEFINKGASVILSARNVDELNRVRDNLGIRKEKATIVPLDLANGDSALLKAKEIMKQHEIDILINNAGVSQRCTFMECLDSLTVERKAMELNYFSVVALTKAAAEVMAKRGSGQIVVISSLAGLVGSPYRTGYSGSKFAISGFYESLRSELHDYGVQVLSIYPGYVNTNIAKNALNSKGEEFGKADPANAEGMSAERFAKKAIRGIFNKETDLLICPLKYHLMFYIKAFCPAAFHYLLRSYSKKVLKKLREAS